MTSLRLADQPLSDQPLSGSVLSDLGADALVVGVTTIDGDNTGDGAGGGVALAGPPALVQALDDAFGGGLPAALAGLGAKGSAGEVTKLPTLGALPVPVLAAVGLSAPRRARRADPGSDGNANPTGPAYDAETLRRAAGAATRALAGCRHVALALPVADAGEVLAVGEGALLGAYAFTRYRGASAADQRPPVEEVTLLTAGFGSGTDGATGSTAEAAQGAVDRAGEVAAAVNLVRDLVNTPPRDLPPAVFAEQAVALAEEAGLQAEVLDDDALRAGGYGGIVGVGQGSVHPPRLVTIRYRPAGATKHVALVGKGITFDSGGLSLKPAQAMEWMKADMGGAAAVIAAVRAIARLGLPVNVTVWAPMAENMPSGTAQRPSDVLTTYGGKTIEVLNTDAEGRLILADALAAASAERPDLIVDVATLTGAQMVALGSRTGGIMSNDDDARSGAHAAAQRAGEAMWPMPLPEELRKSIDSEIADVANMGDRYGGMLVAGLFLREFVGEGLRWVHLDIAGPAFNEGSAYGYTPKGGTGAAVRTLVQIVDDVAAERL